MNTSIVLTIIAKDQPGIVQKVSGLLHRHGGSWSQSSMSSLAGYFAGMLLASLPEANARACVAELQALEAEGIRVIANLSAEKASQAESHHYSLELVGNDHPGIVRDITRVLYSHQANVLSFDALTEAASMGGAELFRAHAKLTIPAGVDVDALEQELEEVANDLMVDIEFMK
jgi:glycine cleavage system regulatory protein